MVTGAYQRPFAGDDKARAAEDRRRTKHGYGDCYRHRRSRAAGPRPSRWTFEVQPDAIKPVVLKAGERLRFGHWEP